MYMEIKTEHCVLNLRVGEYEGDCVNGKRNGFGKLIYKDGSIYEGNWLNEKKNGHGKMIYDNGDIYEGQFENNLEKFGIMKFYDKNIYNFYEGEFLNGNIDGVGKMTYSNGDVYEGQWENRLKQGNGIMIYSNGDSYEGEWYNDIKSKKGKMIYSNGDVYEGEWYIGLKQGKGKMIYSNGDIYEGEWYNNEPDINLKPEDIHSIKIKKQKFADCWAHGISRNFVRTLQILGVIKSKYIEDFYNLFYIILTENKDCNSGGIGSIEIINLFNYLKNTPFKELFFIKPDISKCYKGYCEITDSLFLNMSNEDKEQFIKDMEYLFKNNILFIGKYDYIVNPNGQNKPSKAIKTMLYYRLQPVLGININKYLSSKIYIQNNSYPSVPTSTDFNYNCIEGIIFGHLVNLRKWTKDYVEFKNSYGKYVSNKGNFSVQDLKYLICKKDDNFENTMEFLSLMFDYKKLEPEFKTRVNENLCRYWKTFDNVLETEEYQYYNGSYNQYGLFNGKGKFCGSNYSYDGEWENGFKNGIGKEIYPNGDIYEGQWSYDIRNGYGKMISKEYIYEGQIENGKINGEGKMIYSNGDIYEGQWENGAYNGCGKLNSKYGIYEGKFDKGKYNGKGKITILNSNNYYCSWKRYFEDVRKGLIESDSFYSEWKKYLLDGTGKINYSTNNVYDGEWKYDLIHGQGKMTYFNNDIYEGKWKNGLRHGRGKITYHNGDILEGIWCQDKIVDKIVDKLDSIEDKEVSLKKKYIKYKLKYLNLKNAIPK